MLGKEPDLIETPKVRNFHNAPVIAASWGGVLALLKKNNAPAPLIFAAETVLEASQKADDFARNVELTPEELNARAAALHTFTTKAAPLQPAALAAHHEPAAPLPESYAEAENMVKAAREYKPGARRILLPEAEKETP